LFHTFEQRQLAKRFQHTAPCISVSGRIKTNIGRDGLTLPRKCQEGMERRGFTLALESSNSLPAIFVLITEKEPVLEGNNFFLFISNISLRINVICTCLHQFTT